MKRREQKPYSNPYTGPIRRVDGVLPSDPNHYLWALDRDWYWANRDLGYPYSSRWNFKAIALADGRWLSEGFVRCDESRMRFFPTRQAALRHSAAEMLRTIRHARKWAKGYGSDHVSPEQYVVLVNWAFEKLDRRPPPVKTRPMPAPKPWADLPLFAEAD